MSVPVPKRKPGELDVNTLARVLCVYTLRITGNEKNFPPNQASYSEIMRRTALRIHVLCWRANNIKVNGNAKRYRDRIEAQAEAADLCNDLYAMIEVAKPLYHLSSRRCIYWQGLVVNVRNHIRGWYDSDVKRLKPEG
ncbi:MAG: hypothetical protein IJ523_06650 [Succinivibrionaceae bacterium]|nr:hypothetical protein [Succinivibrionaceae bacterium]